MVAAHKDDLRAAQRVGMRTAFVPRPLEFGPKRALDTDPDSSCEITARSFEELAATLGA
jgi:2-haloacid dehalogenase